MMNVETSVHLRMECVDAILARRFGSGAAAGNASPA
jgi:hypothetical protein